MKFIKIPGKDYEMQDTHITQAEWRDVMGTSPSYVKNKPDHPVTNVSWDDLQQFFAKLNARNDGYTYRLPTEAEWEYCAKPDLKYARTDERLMEVAWCYENASGSTRPVKTKKKNFLGLYDMLGNVWSWCEDLYYEDGSIRVMRAGSYGLNAQLVRSAVRDSGGPGERFNLVGARGVRTKIKKSKVSKTEPRAIQRTKLSKNKVSKLLTQVEQKTNEINDLVDQLRKEVYKE